MTSPKCSAGRDLKIYFPPFHSTPLVQLGPFLGSALQGRGESPSSRVCARNRQYNKPRSWGCRHGTHRISLCPQCHSRAGMAHFPKLPISSHLSSKWEHTRNKSFFLWGSLVYLPFVPFKNHIYFYRPTCPQGELHIYLALHLFIYAPRSTGHSTLLNDGK